MPEIPSRDFDPFFGRPPCRYRNEECPVECEHGYAGPCVLEAAAKSPTPTTP